MSKAVTLRVTERVRHLLQEQVRAIVQASGHRWSVPCEHVDSPGKAVFGHGPRFSRSCGRCGVNRWHFMTWWRYRGLVVSCDAVLVEGGRPTSAGLQAAAKLPYAPVRTNFEEVEEPGEWYK